MAYKNITVGGTDAAPTYTNSEVTMLSAGLNAVLSPIDVFTGDDNVFVSKKQAGLNGLVCALVGMEIGDRFGMSPGRVLSGLR